MDLFESVKSIRTIEAAELYGFHPNRAGMISCLFHQDKTPSMWLNDGYYCHGCHEKGDVIAFTARAFGLTPKDAALKLARDFGIPYDVRTTTAEIKEKEEIISLRDQFQDAAHTFTMTAAACCRKFREWQKEFAPKDPNEIPNDKFVMALRYLPELDYILDEYSRSDLKERIEIISNYGKLVKDLARR